MPKERKNYTTELLNEIKKDIENEEVENYFSNICDLVDESLELLRPENLTEHTKSRIKRILQKDNYKIELSVENSNDLNLMHDIILCELEKHSKLLLTEDYKRLTMGCLVNKTYKDIGTAYGLVPETISEYFIGRRSTDKRSAGLLGIAGLIDIVCILLSPSNLEKPLEFIDGNDNVDLKPIFKGFIDKFQKQRGKPVLKENNYAIEPKRSELEAVREKWIPVVKKRCEKLNVLGTYFNQREQKDIFGLWQTISLSDNNSDGGEFFKIDTDDESMQKFIERMSQKDKLSSKVLVYGNQGLGKTSLLKFFAMKCVNGTFMGDYVPIFLSMPRVYEKSHFHLDSNNLLEYMESWIKSKSEVTSEELKNVLDQGKVLFLLDGIDFNLHILQKTAEFIREFTSNSFILTSNQPISNLESKSTLDLLTNLVNEHDFKVFEMMGFKVNPESKQSFVRDWFKNHSIRKNENDIEFLNEEEKLSLSDSLIKRINSSTSDSPLDNFSSSPLLLQFLCLASLNKNVHNNAETNLLILYQDALFTLITDVEVDEVSKEGIFDPKDDIYRELNLFKRVELLSYIGFKMFKDNHIYAPISKLGEYICGYFQEQNIQTTILEIEKKDEAIIRSIEMQDGLLVNRMWGEYSFSHPTIQEFFASYYISQNPNKWEEVWQDSSHNDKRWEKIFNQAEQILEINLNRFKKLRSK
jgi:hypothetical protein